MTERVSPPRLLWELTGTDRASVADVWAARASRSGTHDFLRFEGKLWTYAQAWDHIRRVASFLARATLRGVDSRVASYLGNCPEAVWTWFGTLRAAKVHVALNRSHRGQVLRHMLDEARPELLVTDSRGLGDLPPLSDFGISTLVLIDTPHPSLSATLDALDRRGIRTCLFAEMLDAGPYEGPHPLPGDTASLMYTSGTTGRSKAARQPHNMFCRGAARFAEAVGLDERDVTHAWFPLFHIAGQLHLTMATIIAGGTLSLQRGFSASRFWDQVNRDGCTLFGALPNVISILMSAPARDADRTHTLRVGIVGPQPEQAIVEAFEDRFRIRLFDSYGMTEVEPLTLPSLQRRPPNRSCGRMNPDFEAAIVDSDGRVLGAGARGELVIRPRDAHLMMERYEGDAEETLRVFSGLWFHTGDLAHISDDGFVFVGGRIKHMIRRRGENISAWELESLLAGHPAVAECVVLGVPSPLGEEDVKAVLVPRPGHALDPAEVHAWCSSRMACFMVPRFIAVHRELPRSPVGKVVVESLRDLDTTDWDAEMSTTTPSPARHGIPGANS